MGVHFENYLNCIILKCPLDLCADQRELILQLFYSPNLLDV